MKFNEAINKVEAYKNLPTSALNKGVEEIDTEIQNTQRNAPDSPEQRRQHIKKKNQLQQKKRELEKAKQERVRELEKQRKSLQQKQQSVDKKINNADQTIS
jgi:chromosome segregation ATPase